MNEETREYLVKTRLNTEVAHKLYDMLFKIWANDDFALGVIGDLEGDEKKLKMIDLLNSGLTDTDEITLNSMAMEQDIDVETLREALNSIDWSKRQVFKINRQFNE